MSIILSTIVHVPTVHVLVRALCSTMYASVSLLFPALLFGCQSISFMCYSITVKLIQMPIAGQEEENNSVRQNLTRTVL